MNKKLLAIACGVAIVTLACKKIFMKKFFMKKIQYTQLREYYICDLSGYIYGRNVYFNQYKTFIYGVLYENGEREEKIEEKYVGTVKVPIEKKRGNKLYLKNGKAYEMETNRIRLSRLCKLVGD